LGLDAKAEKFKGFSVAVSTTSMARRTQLFSEDFDRRSTGRAVGMNPNGEAFKGAGILRVAKRPIPPNMVRISDRQTWY
jgi:hypothetical protein